MELILHEICKHAYARNLNIFNTGIYFNTYKYKPKLKPGENLNLLDEGIFKFNKGSAEKQKVFDKLIDQYFVIENDIYFRTVDGSINLLSGSDGKVELLDYNGCNYNYFNTQSILTKSFIMEDGFNWHIDRVTVFFNEKDKSEFKEHAHFIKTTVSVVKYNDEFQDNTEKIKLNGDFLMFEGMNQEGNLKWSLNLSQVLGAEKGYFAFRKQNIERVYPINNEYWIIYFNDNSILQVDENGKVGWFRIKDAYHTYNFHGTTLYGISDENLVAINAANGEILISKNIVAIKEKYNCPLYRGRGIWIYEDYIFLVSPKRSDEWLVFDKNTLEEVGHMYIDHKDKDEIVMIPGMFCSNFIYSKGKVYINDTADWLRVYEIEFK